MTQSLRVLLTMAAFTFASFSICLNAQSFSGAPITKMNAALQQSLKAWEVYQIDVEALNKAVKTSPNFNAKINLQFGFHNWDIQLTPSGIIPTDYTLLVHSEKGLQKSFPSDPKAFKGYVENGNGKVRLTIDRDFLYGFVEESGKRFYIEPYSYYEPGAPRDLFVFFDMDDVNRDIDATCSVIDEGLELKKIENDLGNHKGETSAEAMACYVYEIAIASDKSMFTKYGSVAAVENHNIGVINDVQGDYTGNFNHDLVFSIVTQFVVTGTDPWTSSLDAGTLLADFRTWGNNGGFGASYDIGELWTNRDFNGGTVGIAYLSAVCTSFKYHCLQDFTSNSELLRCMTSHENGHNFSMVHDSGSGSCPPDYIMCPFVSTSSTWSSSSVSSFNAFVGPLISSGCLSPCGPTATANFSWNPNPACQGQAVQFTDQSTGTVTTRNWTFQSGVPGTSTLANPVVTWNSPGTFNVTLTVNGNSSITKQVTVNPLPVANFTFTVSGLTVTFTNTSTNATGYIWDFGDGVSSFDVNPVHTYADAGNYVVTLTATNDCSSSVKTKNVNTAPTADFSASPTTGCATLFVNFTNESSSNATSYQWQFPGGNPSSSSLTNPIVFYNTAGTYTVTLTAFNASGSAVETKTSYIHVQTTPAPGFTYSINGLVVNFTNTSSGATSYSWNFGDNTTSTLANPVHTYATGGTYTVTLSAINDCGTTTISKTFSLILPPAASFTANPSSGCAPLTVTFNNTSTNATGYSWVFPGGTPGSSTDQNPTVVFNNPGAYTVTLTATNPGGTSTATTTIQVVPEPVAGFTDTITGLVVHFTNTSTNSNTYNWNYGDNSTSSDTNSVHTYATDGTYLVRLIANGPCGIDTFFKNVVIVTPPVANFSQTPSTGCVPLSVQYSYTGTTNASSFSWSFPGGTPNSATIANPVVVYDNPGQYSATLIVGNAAGSDTIVKTNIVTVGTGPNAGFSSNVNGSTANFNNTSTNANSYSWSFGDGGSSNSNNPSHTYTADGTYTVVLTATNACGSSTATQIVTIITPPIANFTASPTTGCAALTVQFTSTASANSSNLNWSFPGGNPSSSTVTNPVVVYDTPGTYNVSLIASNAAGSDTLIKTAFVVVNTTPTPAFTHTENGLSASFINGSSNANTYSWNFGDGNSSNSANPTHTYATDGTYTVVLSASNACGTSTSSQTITVISLPQASFTATNTSGCAPLSVQFTSTSSANSNTFNWNFPGGTPSSSNEQNPVVSYNTPGNYSVTLTVGNAAGTATATQTNYVQVSNLPNAAFSSNVNNNLAIFTNASSGSTSYNWNFGDGTNANDTNPTHIYLADGVYTVVLTATNACGTNTFTQTVSITTPPTAAFSASATNGCAPFTVQFSNQSSANAQNYAWTFPGGSPASSNEQNPITTWTAPGTYTVTLTVSNGAGSSSTSTIINVGSQPTSSFTYVLNAYTVTLTNTSTNANTYSWDFGDGSKSTAANPSHTYAGSGDYLITLVATNDCGSVSYVQTVSIAGIPPVAAFGAGETSGCVPLIVTFNDQSAGNPTSWNWSFQGGNPSTSNQQNPTVSYSVPGSYGVSLVVANAFGSNSITQANFIVAQGLPAAAFTFGTNQGTVTFNNASFNASSYFWDFGDGNTSTQQNPTHVYTATGTYTVTLNAINACGNSALTQSVAVVVTGTNTPEWLNVFHVYPNPNNGVFNVEMQGNASDEVEFTLYNTLGQLVKRDILDYSNGSLFHTFRYDVLPAGVYKLRVRAGNNSAVVQVIVQ